MITPLDRYRLKVDAEFYGSKYCEVYTLTDGYRIPIQHRGTITFDIHVHDFDRLCSDFLKLADIEKEEDLRRSNPALQNAWNEYKTILKLIS